MKNIRVLCAKCGVIEVEPIFTSTGEDCTMVPISVMSKKQFVNFCNKQCGDDYLEEELVEAIFYNLNHGEIGSPEGEGHSIGNIACWSDNP